MGGTTSGKPQFFFVYHHGSCTVTYHTYLCIMYRHKLCMYMVLYHLPSQTVYVYGSVSFTVTYHTYLCIMYRHILCMCMVLYHLLSHITHILYHVPSNTVYVYGSVSCTVTYCECIRFWPTLHMCTRRCMPEAGPYHLQARVQVGLLVKTPCTHRIYQGIYTYMVLANRRYL
jgi:hypothetical protein